MSKRVSRIGVRFGRLVVLGRTRGKCLMGNRPKWYCQCDCGNLVCVNMHSLLAGKTLSCGCYRNEQARKAGSRGGDASIHNRSASYTRWWTMMHNGADVCTAWQNYVDFKEWWAGLKLKPSTRYIMKRVSEFLPYSPDNVCVAEANMSRSPNNEIGQNKMPIALARSLRAAYDTGESINSIARRFMVSRQAVRKYGMYDLSTDEALAAAIKEGVRNGESIRALSRRLMVGHRRTLKLLQL